LGAQRGTVAVEMSSFGLSDRPQKWTPGGCEQRSGHLSLGATKRSATDVLTIPGGCRGSGLRCSIQVPDGSLLSSTVLGGWNQSADILRMNKGLQHWGEGWIYCTVNVAFRVVARYVPEIRDVVLAVTGLVVTVKVMLLLPDGIVTCAGT